MWVFFPFCPLFSLRAFLLLGDNAPHKIRQPRCCREYGKWYSVWQDDASDPTGYRLLKALPERPVADELDDIYNVANGLEDENPSSDFLDSIAKFVRDFGRL